jgi:hypothetical protein
MFVLDESLGEQRKWILLKLEGCKSNHTPLVPVSQLIVERSCMFRREGAGIHESIGIMKK